MISFWIALQFLTVIPIHLKTMPTVQQNATSLLYYPLIGLLIGGILCGASLLLQAVPIFLSSVILTVIWVWLSGGLHLDGLADTADAWVGGFGDRDRTLQIMKEPSCGPIGVLSLLIAILLKCAAISVILELQYFYALVLFPVLARTVPLILFLSCDYVREKGLGTSIKHHLSKPASIVVIILIFLSSSLWGIKGIVSSVMALITIFILRRVFIRRIGGITGDTVGASIEIVEVTTLLSFVLSHYLFRV